MGTIVTKDPTHPDFPHGTYRGFFRGCRCDACKAGNRAYHREYHRKRREAEQLTVAEQADVAAVAETPRVHSGHTVARLRSLVAAGYTPEHLASLLELDPSITWWMLISPPTTVRITFEDRIRAFFRATFFLEPEDTPRATRRAKALATKFDWPLPHQIVDADPRPVPTDGEPA